MAWAADTPGALGAAREQFALAYLQARGLRLLARNYRCRRGEIDLVMMDGDCLVFVEVRYRSRQDYGGAAASVTRTKQQRIITAARHYLQYRPTAGACRFDVLAMDGAQSIQWLRGAFDAF
jgi:putative endonuclease